MLVGTVSLVVEEFSYSGCGGLKSLRLMWVALPCVAVRQRRTSLHIYKHFADNKYCKRKLCNYRTCEKDSDISAELSFTSNTVSKYQLCCSIFCTACILM
jgi:hypothetical protein